MIIKAIVKGKEIEIDIPNSEYWIKRNNQRITPYWTNADNLEKRMAKEFKKTYEALEKELYTFAGKFGTDGQLTYSQKRVIALMKEIKPHIDNLYDVNQTTITEHLMAIYKDNYFKGLYDLAIGTQAAYSFVGINEAAVKTAISFPWSGSNFSDRIYNDKTKLLVTLKQEITNSIIRGEGIKKTAAVVSDRLEISRKNANRLVQTETGAVLTESDKLSYADFGLEQYEYVSTLDNRTSNTCRELDGSVFNLDDMIIGVNAPPTHPNCRSTTSPWFSDNIGKRIARDLTTGKAEYVASDTTYTEWHKKYVD